MLVGLGACAFTIVSGWGFSVVLNQEVNLDPSRIAAQVVSGIGFLGAGVIFKGRNFVRGLTTAATVWVSAAVGMACGAGMLSLGIILTILHLITLFVIAPLIRRMPTADRKRILHIVYLDGEGRLRKVLGLATDMGFVASVLSSQRVQQRGRNLVSMKVRFIGRLPLHDLVPSIAELDGVERVRLYNSNDTREDED